MKSLISSTKVFAILAGAKSEGSLDDLIVDSSASNMLVVCHSSFADRVCLPVCSPDGIGVRGGAAMRRTKHAVALTDEGGGRRCGRWWGRGGAPARRAGPRADSC